MQEYEQKNGLEGFMTASRQTKMRSIVVLVVAALLLELTTAVQYFSTRRGITMQLKEMAQRDLSASNRTAQLKENVEKAIAQLLPDIERLTVNGQDDSLRQFIRQTLSAQPEIVGIDFCHIVGDDGRHDGLYIYKDETNNELIEQTIDFDYTCRSWYSNALDSDGFWSEPYESNYKVILMSTFSRSVRGADGKTVAVLGADVPMSDLSALASQLYDNQHRSLLPIIALHLLGLAVLAFIIQRSIHSVNRLNNVRAEKERITGELSVAQRIQQAMLPKTVTEGEDRTPLSSRDDISVYASLTPAREVGGDFYDFFLRGEKLFFCIGDVSGKGVPAALVMAMAQNAFRMLANRESAPERIVAQMNDAMTRDNEYNVFITLFVGVLDLTTGQLRYTNAGHKAPYADSTLLPIDSNLPIGVLPDWEYTAQKSMISPDTTLFLYTDGLTEAENASHEQFGTKRMTEVIRLNHSSNSLIDTMTTAMKSFVGETEQSDDLTMLAIHYTRQPSGMLLKQSLTLQNDIQQIPLLADFVQQVCLPIGFSSSEIMKVNLAVEEAVVNVMNYAYPLDAICDIGIVAEVNQDCLTFTITDSGKPFDPTTYEAVDTTLDAEERSIGGLGIHLIRQYMDSIDYERRGEQNILTLRKKLKK